MENIETKLMTVKKTLLVPYKSWPKYRFQCGELTRLRSQSDAPERLVDGNWHPYRG